MSATTADEAATREPAFSPRTILALVLVGIVSFSGLAVLAAYAPELRGGFDARAHALSNSAIGYRGAVVMLQARGVPVVVSRAPPQTPLPKGSLLVLTPEARTSAESLTAFPRAATLIVLPKWQAPPDPTRPGYVRKGSTLPPEITASLLSKFSKTTKIAQRKATTRPQLSGVAERLGVERLPLGPIDRLQTIAGPDWFPVVVDETGQSVLVRARSQPGLMVLSEPDLLNTQGIANLATARAGMRILDMRRQGGGGGVRFDVTLAGYERTRGIGRLLLEPPWLAATLCGVAAALLMGFHALARFGPTRRGGRAFALGKRSLVDNSAGLVRMARREHELAPDYAALTRAQIARAGGGERGADTDRWLDDLARLRGAAAPDELAAEAARAKTRADVVAIGRKLYDWKREMTRERR